MAFRSARLTGRGTGILAIGGLSVLGAYVAGRSELLYLGLLLVLLPVLALAFTRFRRFGIVSSRMFTPAIVAVGQPATVDLRVTNTSHLPTPVLTWRDYRPWAAGPKTPGTLPALAARRGATAPSPRNSTGVRYSLVAPRRGVFGIGPMTVVLGDPFGLAEGEVTVGGTDTLIVTPRIAVLGDNGLAIQASDGNSTIVRRAIGGEDDLSTREYRTGDALRRVHWRATARHGELMVRQEEPRSHAEARVILDTRRSGYADVTSRRRDATSDAFELAVSIASSLALHLTRSGFRAEVIETARQQLDAVHPTEPFLRTLATVGLSDEHGDYAGDSPLEAASRPDRAHGSVFAVIADADRETVDRLIVQRQSFDLAIAFVISSRESAQAERLLESGWTVLPVRLEDSVEDIWDAVATVQGVGHGR